MSDLSSNEKGNQLEAAVRSIETSIFNEAPSLREKPVRIEPRKIVTTDGVRHEIDLFVTVHVAKDSDSIFIFECKNWKDAVDKNEIIIFSEKIKSVDAQTGFFVARSYTKDALAQAEKDSRVRILYFDEKDPRQTPSSVIFRIYKEDSASLKLSLQRRSNSDTGEKKSMYKPSIVYKGDNKTYDEYCRDWANAVHKESVEKLDKNKLDDGNHRRSVTWKREHLENELLVDGEDMASSEMTLTFEFTLFSPIVQTDFEIETRGRSISFEPHTVGGFSVERLTIT